MASLRFDSEPYSGGIVRAGMIRNNSLRGFLGAKVERETPVGTGVFLPKEGRYKDVVAMRATFARTFSRCS